MGRNNRTFRKRSLLFVVRVTSLPLVWALRRTPWEWADRIGRAIGAAGYVLSKRYRTVAINNLLAAYPDMTESEAKRIAKQTFCNFMRAFVEFFIAERFGPEDIQRVTEMRGAEHLDEALQRGKGAIMLTAHIGNWEMLARRAVADGYPVTVIARDSDDPTMSGVINSVRESGGYKVLSRDDSVRGALRCLKSNEFLGILPDQNTLGNCEFVEFFGRPVATASGTAMFSLRTGSPILPAFSEWDGKNKKYLCTVYPPVEVALTGNTDADVHNITAAFTKVIEVEIRKHPAEWLWLHSRWKRAGEAMGPGVGGRGPEAGDMSS